MRLKLDLSDSCSDSVPVCPLCSVAVSSCLTRLYCSVAELIRWADQVILQGVAHDNKESAASVTTLIRAVLDGIKVIEPGHCWGPTDSWSSFFTFWNVHLFMFQLSLLFVVAPCPILFFLLFNLALVLSQMFCLSLLLHSPAAPLCHVHAIHVCGLGSRLFGVLPLNCWNVSSPPAEVPF